MPLLLSFFLSFILSFPHFSLFLISGRKCGARLPRLVRKMGQHHLREASTVPPYSPVTCTCSGVGMEIYRSKISGGTASVSERAIYSNNLTFFMEMLNLVGFGMHYRIFKRRTQSYGVVATSRTRKIPDNRRSGGATRYSSSDAQRHVNTNLASDRRPNAHPIAPRRTPWHEGARRNLNGVSPV